MVKQQMATPIGRMGKCLAFYALTPPRPVIPADAGWAHGTLNKALDLDYLQVGAHGYHELSDLGRKELDRLFRTPTQPERNRKGRM